MVINTNVSAQSSSRLLSESSSMLSKSLARLSSGSKIISPEDDAAGMAVSMQAHGLLMASQHACFFHDQLGYHAIEHMEEGVDGRAALARDLGPHRALIMRNHGLLTAGRSVAEAFWLMHTLERACAAQIAELSGGAALHPVSEKAASWFGRLLREKDFSLDRGTMVWPSLLRMLDDADPSYRD